MSTAACETDLLVVGAGPAGVAAAMMAASLGMQTVVVESGSIGGKLHQIKALENMPGSWATGPHLAEALTLDLKRLQQAGRCTVVRSKAVGVLGHADRADLTLEDGRVLSAKAIVVATGVAMLEPADVDWVTAPTGYSAPPLWRTAPENYRGRTYVLGGDRPLGTWLRAHSQASGLLHVLCPPMDDYKVTEVSGDERVRLVTVSHVTISPPSYGEGWTVDVTDRQGERQVYLATGVLNNLGNKPAVLEGLVQGEDGYCPPELQHPRVRIAGDLRAARYQRIATGQGSGAEAVLACYYETALQKA